MKSRTDTRTSRRSFLTGGAATATALAVPVIVPRHVLGGNGIVAPSGRLTIAGVGIGGFGGYQIRMLAKAGFQVEALCDVDDAYAAHTYREHRKARRYRDYREMLTAEGDKIDAVYCGTPDHLHAFVVQAALAKKKHVCCVKPLTRSIEELNVLVEAAHEAGVATQVTATSYSREMGCREREIVASGILGDIVEVHAWSRRPLWPAGMLNYPSFADKVPASLDWDLWLGPAERRPYAAKWPKDSVFLGLPYQRPGNRAVYHPYNHRAWFEFGSGALGDMGCHWANTIYKALDLDRPTLVTAHSTNVSRVSYPLACQVAFDFPKRGNFPELRFVWSDGGITPPTPKELGAEMLPKEGVLYIGTKAKMLIDVEDDRCLRILDEKLDRQARTLPRTLERHESIWSEFLTACKGGERAGCDFDWARRITEFVLLGNLALRTGKPVAYDPVKVCVKGNAAANDLLRLRYHNGYRLGNKSSGWWF